MYAMLMMGGGRGGEDEGIGAGLAVMSTTGNIIDRYRYRHGMAWHASDYRTAPQS